MSKRPIFQTGLTEIINSPYSLSLELRNQLYTNNIHKKDKRKSAVKNRLINMEEAFIEDKNEYYKSSLAKLQKDLTTTHNETNEQYLEKLKNSQERRDYELTRLRLWEDYQVSKVEKDSSHDVEHINEEYDNFIKIIKDKLYEKLVKKIKLLKEDKVLKDLANVNHYCIDIDLMSNDNHNRANQEPQLEDTTTSPKKKLVSITSEKGHTNGFSDSNTNLNPLSRRAARRTRGMESAYNTDSNVSGNDSSLPGYISSSSNKRRRFQTARAAGNTLLMPKSYSSASNDESNFISDNNSLSEILFGKNYSSSGGGRSSHGGPHGNGGAQKSSRTKSKQFSGVQGLKPEEINEDLPIFESCLGDTSSLFLDGDIQNGNVTNGRKLP